MFPALVCGQNVTATRMDIEGVAEKVAFTNLSTMFKEGQVGYHTWDKVNGTHRIFSEYPLSAEGWKQVGFQFTPLSNGVVTLVLMGQWKQTEDKKSLQILPVIFDRIEIEGAEIKNGDFEELDEKGLPKYWGVPAPLHNDGDFHLLKDPTKVKSGSVSVFCWQNQRLTQTIAVKANQRVSIRAWSMPAR